jgi:lipopolysaccharide transport system permease protein
VTVAREQSTAPQEKERSGMEPSREALPEMVFTPPSGWPGLHLRELWEFRDLLYFLAWRDIKVRYKQTVLGVAWQMSSERRRLPRAKLEPGTFFSVPPDIIQRHEAKQANA